MHNIYIFFRWKEDYVRVRCLYIATINKVAYFGRLLSFWLYENHTLFLHAVNGYTIAFIGDISTYVS